MSPESPILSAELQRFDDLVEAWSIAHQLSARIAVTSANNNNMVVGTLKRSGIELVDSEIIFSQVSPSVINCPPAAIASVFVCRGSLSVIDDLYGHPSRHTPGTLGPIADTLIPDGAPVVVYKNSETPDDRDKFMVIKRHRNGPTMLSPWDIHTAADSEILITSGEAANDWRIYPALVFLNDLTSASIDPKDAIVKAAAMLLRTVRDTASFDSQTMPSALKIFLERRMQLLQLSQRAKAQSLKS